MLIDRIPLFGLRVFESVYRNQSMSKAAKELFMTQPGVSQHIKQIEVLLETQLFDRIGKNIIPTTEGRELFDKISPILFELETSLSGLNKSGGQMRGVISFGMPIEFGNNVILPYLSEWSQKNVGVYFKINYDHAQRQLGGLLNGTLDFAFTDSFAFPDQIATINLAREHLVLCTSIEYASNHDLNKHTKFEVLKELDFVTYLEDATIVKQWFMHHYKKEIQPNKRATLMDVQGVSRLILSGLGIGVLPFHMVKQRQLQDQLIIFEGSDIPLYNEINLSMLKGKTQSIVSQKFIEYLREKLKLRMMK